MTGELTAEKLAEMAAKGLTRIPALDDLLDNLVLLHPSEVALSYERNQAKAEILIDGVSYIWLDFKKKPELIRKVIQDFQGRVKRGCLYHLCQKGYFPGEKIEAVYKVKEASPNSLRLEIEKVDFL